MTFGGYESIGGMTAFDRADYSFSVLFPKGVGAVSRTRRWVFVSPTVGGA